jgi:pyrroloquinoline quinone biosynthesis protein D
MDSQTGFVVCGSRTLPSTLKKGYSMIEGNRVFKLSDNVSFQPLGENEGAVVLTLNNGELHTCNDTTAAFLNALDGSRTFDMAVAALEKEFDVDPNELRADLFELADNLLRAGVIL